MFNIFTYCAGQSITWLRRSIAFNSAYNELEQLTDQELADLGITRGELHNVVANTLRQRIPSQSF